MLGRLFHGGCCHRCLILLLQFLLQFLDILSVLVLLLFQVLDLIVAAFQFFFNIIHTFGHILAALFEILFYQYRAMQFVDLEKQREIKRKGMVNSVGLSWNFHWQEEWKRKLTWLSSFNKFNSSSTLLFSFNWPSSNSRCCTNLLKSK